MSKWEDRTRGGHKFRIYAEDGAGAFPIHGAVFLHGAWYQVRWSSCGVAFADGRATEGFNLIPARREAWVLFSEDGGKPVCVADAAGVGSGLAPDTSKGWIKMREVEE